MKALQSIKTYQAQFTQSVWKEGAKKADISTGTFFIHRPHYFKWHTQKPYEQMIVADGERLWTYEPDFKQVTIQNQAAVLVNSPLFLLTSKAEALEKKFIIKNIKKKNKTDPQLFLLTPKEKSSLFESVRLLIKEGNILELYLMDALGAKTSVVFTHMIRNKTIEKSVFTFTPPKGTDIIDSREKK
jgi:outer membrane lipoprotein carrier protein